MEPGPASPQATADSTASVAAELRRGLETLANSSPNLEERKQAAAALKAIEEEEKRADAAKATARSYLTALKPKASLDDSTVKLPPHPQSVAADNQQQLNSPTKQAPTQHKEIADLEAKLETALATTAEERRRAAEEAVKAANNDLSRHQLEKKPEYTSVVSSITTSTTSTAGETRQRSDRTKKTGALRSGGCRGCRSRYSQQPESASNKSTGDDATSKCIQSAIRGRERDGDKAKGTQRR